MRHRLIIVYGSSPGAGKSSLSSYVFEQINYHGVPVRWIYEEDFLHLDTFRSFLDHFLNANVDQILPSLLDASSSFVQEILQAEPICITDSILPYSNWLFATDYFSEDTLVDFFVKLDGIVAELNPLLVYLDVDSAAGLQRATEQRGESWLAELSKRVRGYGYNKDKEFESPQAVVDYFDAANRFNLSLLSHWSGDKRILDATNNSRFQLQSEMMEILRFEHVAIDMSESEEALHKYRGCYRSDEDELTINNPIKIKIVDGALWVDAYWPNGCSLIRESPGQYRLHSTSHRIIFKVNEAGAVESLCYNDTANSYRFGKVDAIES